MRVLLLLIEPNSQLALPIPDHLPMLSPATHHVLLQTFSLPLQSFLSSGYATKLSLYAHLGKFPLGGACSFSLACWNLLQKLYQYAGHLQNVFLGMPPHGQGSPWPPDPGSVSNKSQPTLWCPQFETLLFGTFPYYDTQYILVIWYSVSLCNRPVLELSL